MKHKLIIDSAVAVTVILTMLAIIAACLKYVVAG